MRKLARVKSLSTKGLFYEIRQADDGKTVYCTCPAWRYCKPVAGVKDCKHLVAWRARQATKKGKAA